MQQRKILIRCLSITQYRRTGFFEQEIIWKSSKKENVGEKLKKLAKLSNNETLYFKCLELFESHFNFFSFKFNFLEFCNNFVPDFENLYYLLHLNTSDSIKGSSSENSESKQDCSKNSCKNACLEIGSGTSKVRNSENIEGERNANGNQAVLLGNRLKSHFVSKNVVNLSKQNFNDAEIYLLSKGLNFVPTCCCLFGWFCLFFFVFFFCVFLFFFFRDGNMISICAVESRYYVVIIILVNLGKP